MNDEQNATKQAQIDVGLLIEALQEQRNRAMNEVAALTARSVQFQRELEQARAELAQAQGKE